MNRSHRRAVAGLVLLASVGCGRRAPVPGPPPAALLPPATPEAAPEYRITVGDEFDVRFEYQPDLNMHLTVRPDGRISMPATGELSVVGLTPHEVEELIVRKTSERLRNPEVALVMTHMAEQRVYVGGEVLKPSYVPLRPDMTPLQAVLQVGGFKDTAKLESVLIMTPLPGGKIAAARVDMAQVVKDGVPERVRLHPNDVIYVPKTWIANADVVVDQWVRGLIPALPRIGAGYVIQ
jgi:protein involved in polysaccharide export with SLBB domain